MSAHQRRRKGLRDTYSPDIDSFLALSREHYNPDRTGDEAYTLVSRHIAADLDTPVSALLKIKRGEHAFLLESVEGGQVGRYSFLGTEPHSTFVVKDGKVEVRGEAANLLIRGKEVDPLSQLQALVGARHIVASGGGPLPRFCGGAVGYAGYETVCTLEPVAPARRDATGFPDIAFALYDTFIVFDHVKRTAEIATLARLGPDPGAEYGRVIDRIDTLARRLRGPVPSRHGRGRGITNAEVRSNYTQPEFERMVDAAREHIAAGDIIQVVLSQRFERQTGADPFSIYRALRMVNPSPYMFYIEFDGYYLSGASPEMLVQVEGTKVTTHPIAGTAPRSENRQEDLRLEKALLADEKERAEHLMLVDLARNDIGRIARTGTVKVPRFMDVERFSHVMHLVSEVEGELREGLGPVDVLRACFPAGTVSGAPKVRAMQIIAEQEFDHRGSYAGAAGYISYDGNMDTAIVIRTIAVRDGVGYVQAGAGIVADSVPSREYQETIHKARAVMAAIDLAERIEAEEEQEEEAGFAPELEEVRA
jgi:anthranilate synthase component 1